MNRLRWLLLLAPAALALAVPLAPAQSKLAYVKKQTRTDTVLATLRANGLPTLEGTWHSIGPFNNSRPEDFDTPYPPEKEIDLVKTYPGKGGKQVGWKVFPQFLPGR